MSVLARYVCGYNSRLTSVAVATHMLSTKTKIYKKKNKKALHSIYIMLVQGCTIVQCNTYNMWRMCACGGIHSYATVGRLLF